MNCKKINDTTIKDLRNLFRLKKENKAIKNRAIWLTKKLHKLRKEHKETKNRVIRDITNLLEHEEENYKSVRIDNFGVIFMLNVKVRVTDIKHYQLKNILIRLNST